MPLASPYPPMTFFDAAVVVVCILMAAPICDELHASGRHRLGSCVGLLGFFGLPAYTIFRHWIEL